MYDYSLFYFYTMEQQYFDVNKEAWNKRTIVHKNSDFYNLASFKAGKSALNKTELDDLGDVTGKEPFASSMPFWYGYIKLGKKRRYSNRYRFF